MQSHILRHRYIYFGFSAICIILSLCTFFFGKLNLGIDMTGGIQQEFSYNTYQYDPATIQQKAEAIAKHRNVESKVINSVGSYKITGEKSFVVETGFTRTLDEKTLEQHKITYRNELEEAYKNMGDIVSSKYTNIGASFGDYIKKTAKLTLLLAIIGIALYIGYAFSGFVGGIPSMSFAFITIITLFHDVIISTGLYIFTSGIFPQFQIDTFFITALLTILGYSINDTIVIFDRIRSNLKNFGGRGKNLQEIIELSISESFTRSIYTSLTLVFVLLCILIFGPESISGFTLTMLFGTIVGTFSSIFIASPLLYELHKNTTLSVYQKREERTEEDKMVV